MHDLTALSNEAIQKRIDLLEYYAGTRYCQEIECHCGDEFDEGTRIGKCHWDDADELADVLFFRGVGR